MSDNPKPIPLLQQLLETTIRCGADAADAVLFDSTDMQISIRNGAPEGVERAESAGLGLRAWVGAKQAVISSTDTSEAAFKALSERVVAMARASTEDAESTLAPASLLAKNTLPLDLFDGEEPTPEWLLAQASACEAAALSTPGITNSEGADAAFGANRITLCTRPKDGAGFAGHYASSYFSLSVSVLAGEGTNMERDYDYSSTRWRSDLASAESIGKNAASRALSRLNPRRVPTCDVPVVFDPRVSRSLLSAFAGAINGANIARGTSFLKADMGKALFAPNINIIDDAHIPRGLASRPFDAEGVSGGKRALVENGVLTSWLLDVRTANRLGLATTGHASRGVGSGPSPSSTNLYMQAGNDSPNALLAGIKSGFYVTETFGMGVNLITGDYSQGASGFWIENGEVTYPVSEVTIAGHLREMFTRAIPADDLTFRYATNAPTLRIDTMTVAGT